MRWSHPKNMETRQRSSFLWFPKRIGTVTKWLERAWWIDQYSASDTCGYWRAHYWTKSPTEDES